MEQWQQFQVMASQLVPTRDTILLTVTSQGQQSALQKSRPVNIGQYRYCVWIGLNCCLMKIFTSKVLNYNCD